MAKSVKILIAAITLSAGVGAKRFTLDKGEEMTAAAQKALGLKNSDVGALLDRGHLTESSARVADASKGNPAIVAVEKRADDAETALAVETKRADGLQEELANIEIISDAAADAAGEGAQAAA